MIISTIADVPVTMDDRVVGKAKLCSDGQWTIQFNDDSYKSAMMQIALGHARGISLEVNEASVPPSSIVKTQ